MNCQKCFSPNASYGSPHSEEIKQQLECPDCGHLECEYYAPDELAAIELAQLGYHYRDALRAVALAGGDLPKAERILNRQSKNI